MPDKLLNRVYYRSVAAGAALIIAAQRFTEGYPVIAMFFGIAGLYAMITASVAVNDLKALLRRDDDK